MISQQISEIEFLNYHKAESKAIKVTIEYENGTKCVTEGISAQNWSEVSGDYSILAKIYKMKHDPEKPIEWNYYKKLEE